jgi:hypothetical protein
MLVFGYRIYNGSVQIASSSTANYILNGATNYTFSVKAFDAAGNISNGSNNLAIKLWQAPTTPTTSVVFINEIH